MDFTRIYTSPLGSITLASDGEALTGLWFEGQEHFGDSLTDEHTPGEAPVFALAEQWLDLYFSGIEPGFTPPLHLRGTHFRRRVWELLLTVPYGRTVTYGALAARLEVLGLPKTSARAVGGAVGRNPISLIIPCHRVIGADGSLTGYAAGLARKRALMELEKTSPQHIVR